MCSGLTSSLQCTSRWLLQSRISSELKALSSLCIANSIIRRWLTFYPRAIDKTDFHVAAPLSDCRVLASCFSVSKLRCPRVAPGKFSFWHITGSECSDCWTIKALPQKLICLACSSTLSQVTTQNLHFSPFDLICERGWEGFCQMPHQMLPGVVRCLASLPCSCWAVTDPSLTCSRRSAATPHPSLGVASPVPAKAKALSNREQNFGHQSATNVQQQRTEQTDSFLKHST